MDNWNLLKNMLIEEKVMSQKETVSSVEKTVIFNLVDRLLSTTHVEKALKILDGAIRCESSDTAFYQKKSQILLNEGYVENAIAVLRKAHEVDESNIDVILEVIQAYKVSKNYKGGLDFTNEVLEKNLNGLELEILLAKVELMICQGTTGEAYDLLVNLMFHFPNDAGICKEFIKVTTMERLQTEATKVMEDVIDANPYATYVWYSLGHLYYHQCRYAEARMAYEYAYLIDPMFEQAYRHYVSVSLDTCSYKKALQAYSEMIEKFTLKAEDFISISDCYVHFKDYDRSIKFLDFATKKDTMNPEVYAKIAETYMAKGTHSFCINYINKAIRLDSTNESYHLLKAEALYKLDRKDEAQLCFREATHLSPMIADTWTDYAKVQISSGDYQAALYTLDTAMMESSSPFFLYLQSVCHFGLKSTSNAMQTLEEALKDSFSEHEILFELMPNLGSDKKIKDMIAYYLFED